MPRLTVFDAKELLVKRYGFYLLMWSKKMWHRAILDILVRNALGRKL